MYLFRFKSGTNLYTAYFRRPISRHFPPARALPASISEAPKASSLMLPLSRTGPERLLVRSLKGLFPDTLPDRPCPTFFGRKKYRRARLAACRPPYPPRRFAVPAASKSPGQHRAVFFHAQSISAPARQTAKSPGQHRSPGLCFEHQRTRDGAV